MSETPTSDASGCPEPNVPDCGSTPILSPLDMRLLAQVNCLGNDVAVGEADRPDGEPDERVITLAFREADGSYEGVIMTHDQARLLGCVLLAAAAES